MHQIQNNSTEDITHLTDIIDKFIPYSQQKLGFHKPVMLSFQSDEENANRILGKTAFYDPGNYSVTVFVTGRHPKDVLRSLSHELVHHAQNCRGDFSESDKMEQGYAQKNPHLRDMELEAYEKGNIIFRDFEDLIKAGKINITLTGEPKMTLKEWKDNELNMLLMKKWGLLKEGAKPDFLDLDKDGDKEESMKDTAADAELDEGHDQLAEDTEGEETYHYGEDEGQDEKELGDLLRRHADRAHIDALKRDMDYDEEHERRHERDTHFRENQETDSDLQQEGGSMVYKDDDEESEARGDETGVQAALTSSPLLGKGGELSNQGRKRTAEPALRRLKGRQRVSTQALRREEITLAEAREVARRIFEKIQEEK
jgi:hypothetical protein